VSIGNPISISEGGVFEPPVVYERNFAGDAAASQPAPETPIQAGELDVVVNVNVTWEIK
jgi:uncharacterized protein YggE